MNRKIARRAVLGTIVGIVGIVPGFLSDSQYVIEDVQVEQPPGPISLDVTALEPNIEYGSAGEIELSVTNEGDEPIELENHGITPFGVLRATPTEGGLRIRLDNPAYEDSDYVDISPNGSTVDLAPLIATIDPGETISEVYDIDGSDIDGNRRFDVYAEEWLLAYQNPESGEDIEATDLITLEIEPRQPLSL